MKKNADMAKRPPETMPAPFTAKPVICVLAMKSNVRGIMKAIKILRPTLKR